MNYLFLYLKGLIIVVINMSCSSRGRGRPRKHPAEATTSIASPGPSEASPGRHAPSSGTAPRGLDASQHAGKLLSNDTGSQSPGIPGLVETGPFRISIGAVLEGNPQPSDLARTPSTPAHHTTPVINGTADVNETSLTAHNPFMSGIRFTLPSAPSATSKPSRSSKSSSSCLGAGSVDTDSFASHESVKKVFTLERGSKSCGVGESVVAGSHLSGVEAMCSIVSDASSPSPFSSSLVHPSSPVNSDEDYDA